MLNLGSGTLILYGVRTGCLFTHHHPWQVVISEATPSYLCAKGVSSFMEWKPKFNWVQIGHVVEFSDPQDLTTYPPYCRRWEIYQENGNTIYLLHTVDVMCYSGAEVFLLVINRKSFLSSFWFAVCTKYNFSYYHARTEYLSCRVRLHYR